MSIMSVVWVIAYLAIALLCLPIVKILGPVSISSYRLEESYDQDSGVPNVIYRIISPVLCCGFCTWLLGVLALFLHLEQLPPRWLAVLFYWALLFASKVTARKLFSGLAFAVEALVAVFLSVSVDEFVMQRLLEGDFNVLDESSIAFQLELAMFYMLVQLVVSSLTRRQYKLYVEQQKNYLHSQRSSSSKTKRSYYPLVDTSERKLFGYERRFAHLLPQRYSDDALLRVVFFTIMAIEDANRPEGFRIFERIACKLGVAKTTGIMQQKSDKPLSDDESVVLACQYIENMWDNFLSRFAKSEIAVNHPDRFSFSSTWYEYDYRVVAELLDTSFGKLYGDYCGTRSLPAEKVFKSVRLFYEGKSYGLMPKSIVVPFDLFPNESIWMSGGKLFWKTSYTVAQTLPPTLKGARRLYVYECSGAEATSENIAKLCSFISSTNASIQEISFIQGTYASVVCDTFSAPAQECSAPWKQSVIDINSKS